MHGENVQDQLPDLKSTIACWGNDKIADKAIPVFIYLAYIGGVSSEIS